MVLNQKSHTVALLVMLTSPTVLSTFGMHYHLTLFSL